jgi:hypothetical protein
MDISASENQIAIGRPYSNWRIRAYECEVDVSDKVVKKGKSVTGWYGLFTEDKLKNEIIPKLSEYAAQGNVYPFLIVSYRLENKANVIMPEGKPLPRRQISPIDWVAIVYPSSKYKILSKC